MADKKLPDKNKKVNKNKKVKNNSKLVKINSDFESKNFIYAKKLRLILLITIIIFVLLICRIGFLQFVQGSYLKEQAYKQQAINQIISPNAETFMILLEKL